MKHAEKVKLARKMRTPQEELDGVALFSSVKWKERKEAKARKQLPKEQRLTQ